ncbi:unnamed protein product [Caenorhabditis brenneri]
MKLEMIDVKVYILGFTILIAFIFYSVGIFTPTWILVKNAELSIVFEFRGVISFNSAEPGWLSAGRWLMSFSFISFILIIIFYCIAFFQVNNNGCPHKYRIWFYSISVCSAIILILTPTAITLIGINGSYGLLTLGFTVWLYMTSIMLTVASLGISGYIAYKECR